MLRRLRRLGLGVEALDRAQPLGELLELGAESGGRGTILLEAPLRREEIGFALGGDDAPVVTPAPDDRQQLGKAEQQDGAGQGHVTAAPHQQPIKAEHDRHEGKQHDQYGKRGVVCSCFP